VTVPLRRPVEADHRALAPVVDGWFGGRRVWPLLSRAWFRHFTGTSWVATRPDGRPIGLAIGFVSPDHPTTGHLHVIAVDPAHRRNGLGSELVTRCVADAIERGATTVATVAWADDRPTIGFLQKHGFQLLDPPGGQHLYGMPAIADFDAPGDDRAQLELRVATPR